MTASDREFDVVVLGGINTDFVVRGRELPAPGASRDGLAFLQGPGGKGANAAVAAIRLGARTAIIGRVGDDDRGRMLLAGLTDQGVDVTCVTSDQQAPTGAAVIQVDASGQKQIMAALGANLQLTLEDVDRAATIIRSSRVLLMQLEVPVECVAAAARIAKSAAVQIVLDPAPPRPLPDVLITMIDVIRANAGEIAQLTDVRVHDRASARQAAGVLRGRGGAVVIVATEGGNLLVSDAGETWLPELPVNRVDETGAGDAFAAAFAVALAEGQALANGGRFASGAAALATATLGAQTGLPHRQELQAYLDRVAPVTLQTPR
jgi:ribokinase